VKRKPAAENGRLFLLTVGRPKISVIKVAILNDLRVPFGLLTVTRQQTKQTRCGGVKLEHFKGQAFFARLGTKN
jgi:hypothetical protein